MLQTEFAFSLPCGFVDGQGTLHQHGLMRRAMALDEVEALAHPRVRANEAYLGILLLAQTVIRLGALENPGATVMERLFATDFIYLQALYARINAIAPDIVETACPGCGRHFLLDVMEYDERAESN
jgi:hypothetical protein